tara:strand:- start:6640 stop:6873 length:234 start_codon:yes stop_codon:yes gene_type:complete
LFVNSLLSTFIGPLGIPSSSSELGSSLPPGFPGFPGFPGTGLDFFLLSFFTSCFLGIVSGTGYGSSYLISSTGSTIY